MNQFEQDMVNDIQMAKENMDEAIRIYQTAQNRYYAYIIGK